MNTEYKKQYTKFQYVCAIKWYYSCTWRRALQDYKRVKAEPKLFKVLNAIVKLYREEVKGGHNEY